MEEKEKNCIKDIDLESLSYKRVAELLDISYSEVRKLVRIGKLQAFLASPRRPRIRKKVLLEYITRLEKGEM